MGCRRAAPQVGQCPALIPLERNIDLITCGGMTVSEAEHLNDLTIAAEVQHLRVWPVAAATSTSCAVNVTTTCLADLELAGWQFSSSNSAAQQKGGRTRGKQVYLGGYVEEVAAARAYDRAAIAYWPDNPTLNVRILPCSDLGQSESLTAEHRRLDFQSE